MDTEYFQRIREVASLDGDTLAADAAAVLSKTDFDRLKNLGIYRNVHEYEFIVTYPMAPLMGRIDGENLFGQEKRRDNLGFYVHVPFCNYMCTYCARFLKFKNTPQKLVEEYLQGLKAEFKLLARRIGVAKVTSVYIGGGTPTCLTGEQFKELISAFKENFEIASRAEFTVEGSPESMNLGKLSTLKDLGVNRFSFGVQSFDDRLLKICGRSHTGSQAVEAFHMCREAGFRNVNIDLISGLPNQTPKGFSKDLEICNELMPDSVTIYPLYIQKESPMTRFPITSIPTQEENLLLIAMGKLNFSSLGYIEKPVHFFTSPELSHNYTSHKWKSSEFVGTGLSAFGYVNSVQYHNTFNMQEYLQATKSGKLPVSIGAKLSVKERMHRFAVLGIKIGQLSSKEFEVAFGKELSDVFRNSLAMLENAGLVELKGDDVRLTFLGSLYSEEVAKSFFSEETSAMLKEQGLSSYGGYSTATALKASVTSKQPLKLNVGKISE